MSRSFFLSLSDWKIMVESIDAQMLAHRDACIEARDYASKEYERGWYDALRSVIDLPQHVLKDDGTQDEKEPEINTAKDAVRLVPERVERRLSKVY